MIDTIREAMADMNKAEQQAYARGVATGLEAAIDAADRALAGQRSSPGSTAIVDALVGTSRVVIGALTGGQR